MKATVQPYQLCELEMLSFSFHLSRILFSVTLTFFTHFSALLKQSYDTFKPGIKTKLNKQKCTIFWVSAIKHSAPTYPAMFFWKK